jgi:hypothetical protein
MTAVPADAGSSPVAATSSKGELEMEWKWQSGGVAGNVGAFAMPAMCKYPVNVRTAATMFNVNVVNVRSMVLKLPVFWQ